MVSWGAPGCTNRGDKISNKSFHCLPPKSKLYTEMNTEQKQKPKNNFEKDFFKLDENVRNFYKPISLHFHFQFHFIFVVSHLKIHPAVHLNTSKALTLL